MNEKRFVLCKKGDVEYIEDNGCVQLYGFDVLCEMLNEQQSTISQLQKKVSEYELLYQSCSDQRDEFFRGATENAKLVGEQQATINELEQENADLLGDNIRSLDEFEKCTNKLKAKILEQQSTIQRMKHSLNTIYKAFEKHYGYDMRNAVWLIDELSYDEIVDDEINKEIGFDSDE